MAAPYGDGLYANEPPFGDGLNITDLFHIVERKPDDPGINSAVDSQYPNVAIITFDRTNQFGGMWSKEKLDLTMPFSTEMYLHLGHQYNKTGNPADGMTFTLHNNPAEINAIGGAGEGIGVYRGRKWTGVGQNTVVHGNHLKNSLVIEFDTYRNLRKDGAYVDDPGNAGTSHCALLIPISDTIIETDHKNVHQFIPSQRWIKFKVDWIPNGSGGGTLNYSFDDYSAAYTINDMIAVFKGTKVYWGFTGATGQQTAVQAAAITRLPKQGIAAEKTVRNQAGEDIDHGTAFQGDIINYSVKVTAMPLINPIGPVIIYDDISEYVEYPAGNVRVTTSAGDEFEVMPSFSGNTMTINTNHFLTEDGDWLEITFDVKVKEDAAGKIVYNSGIISADGLTESQETNTTDITILSAEDPVKKVSESSGAGQNGSAVKVGDSITYEISYLNYDNTDAEIVITDRLPDGVDFESSPDGGIYDDVTRTVTWIIPNVPSGGSGAVSVVVLVNKNAMVKIENSAMVKVGDSDPRSTNNVKNPVTPENPEKMVSENSESGRDGSAVKAGDKITYDITYLNYEEEAASITIIDILPIGVDFYSATDNGVYDEATHTVTWTLTDVPSGFAGEVSVTAVVSEKAVVKIENNATVKVGNNNSMPTNYIENPVTPKDPEKKVSESSEAGKDGSAVKAGDKITYDISYLNYEESAATIIITDTLAVGVDFESADNGGIYDDAIHNVTWILTEVPSGSSGTVSVTVRVNERAMVKVENNAAVKVGDNGQTITNTVENPVVTEGPKKKISESSESGQGGSAVKSGNRITYDITYLNYEDITAEIIIIDRLPIGVDFESATDNGSYDNAAHTITWVLEDVPGGAYGTVSAVVRVNKKAVVKIENYAAVQVGDNAPQNTNNVVNPIKGSSCSNMKQATKCRKAITGSKKWLDNNNEHNTRPPSIEIVLLRDGIIYKSISVNSAEDGVFNFGCLPIWKNSEHKYNYQVDEAAVPYGYSKSIEGYNITNTLTAIDLSDIN